MPNGVRRLPGDLPHSMHDALCNSALVPHLSTRKLAAVAYAYRNTHLHHSAAFLFSLILL